MNGLLLLGCRGSGGRGNSAAKDVLDELTDYMQTHFSTEEELMRRYGYPEFPQHLNEHQALIVQVKDLRDKVHIGEAAVGTEVMNFLKSWLIKHIQGTDKRYAPFLRSHGVEEERGR